MFRLELCLQRHLGGCEVDPVPRPLVCLLVTRLPVHDAAPRGHGVCVHLVLVTGHTRRPTHHWGPVSASASEGRVALTGDAVRHPARARKPRPVRAAHGALAGPGRGPGAERVGL